MSPEEKKRFDKKNKTPNIIVTTPELMNPESI